MLKESHNYVSGTFKYVWFLPNSTQKRWVNKVFF